MNERFADLKKVPRQPASRLLAMANAKIETKITSPANASVEAVLEELDSLGGHVDMMRLMSVALPPRERTWWACLAARDLIGPDAEKVPLPLATAEHWVRKPSDASRDAARDAAENSEVDDDTTLCAVAVSFCDGTLGTGDLAQHPGPPGAAQTAVFCMNLKALEAIGGALDEAANILVDRALDIARGGTGKITTKVEEVS